MKKMNSDDRYIADMMKRQLPRERIDPWFKNKVLNRLPPRRRKGNVPEKWAFLAAMMGVVLALGLQSVHMTSAQVVYVKDFLIMGFLLCMFIALTAWLVAPLLRN